jgi:cystathionine gamma-synthase/methionine-gamma-lyase
MAAVHAALLAAGVRSGSAVLGALDLYGATFTMLRSLFAELGAKACFVDVSDLPAVEAALAETRPAALMVETISNPLLKVADIPALAELTHRYGAELLVDNTFATPYLFNPLAYGADYVIHSATKYIGGHGDVMAGVVVTQEKNHRKLYELNKTLGGILGPFEAWLALRGVKTLPLRMRRQCKNAAQVAAWLFEHPRVARVNYPGLVSHPQHSLASRLFVPPEAGGALYGGMLSFEIAGAHKEQIFRFMEALRLCLPATTLGDIYTLVLYPPMSSHRSLTEEERAQVGISEGLVRLSAGIEDPSDILADLERALIE